MSTKTLRVGIIGAGMAGQAHAFGFRNAMMVRGSEPVDLKLTCIADPNLELAESVARRFGFQQATADVDALINSDVDIISVALPNFLHAQVLPKVLASGKHLFAEKPIGRTPQEASSLAQLAQASDAVTGVGFSFRRLPGLAAVAAAVEEGLIGTVHTVRAWYNADYAANPDGALTWRYSQEESGGGALLDIGAHALDAVEFVAGRIAEVHNATLNTVIKRRPLAAAGAVGHDGAVTGQLGDVTNDDVALLTLGLENGALGQVQLSRIAHGVPNSLGVELFGDAGSITFDSIRGGEFQIFAASADGVYNGPRTVYTGPSHPYFNDVASMPGTGVGTGYAEAFVAEIQEFVRCVRDGQPMSTDFSTAERMMNVVGAAYESHQRKEPVAVKGLVAQS